MQEDAIDASFWPALADLMLALVLILVLVLFVVTAVISADTVNLSKTAERQQDLTATIAQETRGELVALDDNTVGIVNAAASCRIDGSEPAINEARSPDIVIQTVATLQRIRFSDRILFAANEYVLNEKGECILDIVGAALRKKIGDIREVQIQGHADNYPTRKYSSNLHLAAYRAIEVFQFLRDRSGIDPARYLMSISSFGEYRPVQRSDSLSTYDAQMLEDHNRDEQLRNQNRRIELLLIYQL